MPLCELVRELLLIPFPTAVRAASRLTPSQPATNQRVVMRNVFRRFAHVASEAAGSPYAFLLAIAGIAVWACLGPWTGFSDTWQLVVNTATTIVTFLMVFLIQNMQNRDAKAVQLKLDELIRAVGSARNRLIDLEELSDEELEQLRKDFQRLSRRREQANATAKTDAAVRQPTVEPSAS